MIDVSFPASGTSLPIDHAYQLFSAVSRAVPSLHQNGTLYMLGNIPGTYAERGLIELHPGRSRLWFRLPAEEIGGLLTLAGRTFDVAGHELRLGIPQVSPLRPASALIARNVTIKGFIEPVEFLAAARRQLNALGVAGEIGIPRAKTGRYEGEPRRHVLRIKGKKIVGFTLQVVGLTADESIRLQEAGIGGRRHLGCGFFIPLKEAAQ